MGYHGGRLHLSTMAVNTRTLPYVGPIEEDRATMGGEPDHKTVASCRDQWEHRNNIVHKKDKQHRTSEVERLNRAITRGKRRGGDARLAPRDRNLLRPPLSTLLRMNVDDKIGWLERLGK